MRRAVQGEGDGGALHDPPFGHEGTARPSQRPTEAAEPQEDDRGQKTCHTLKTLLVSNETGHGCFLSYTYAGKAADTSLAEVAG